MTNTTVILKKNNVAIKHCSCKGEHCILLFTLVGLVSGGDDFLDLSETNPST